MPKKFLTFNKHVSFFLFIQLTEEREESDEVRRQLTNTKRKLTKLNAEMEDMKLLLESVQSRNSELEKKQKRYGLLFKYIRFPA